MLVQSLGLGRSLGGRHRNPLQYSCLENPRQRRIPDRGAWWATVHEVTKSWTWLKQPSIHACRYVGISPRGMPPTCISFTKEAEAWKVSGLSLVTKIMSWKMGTPSPGPRLHFSALSSKPWCLSTIRQQSIHHLIPTLWQVVGGWCRRDTHGPCLPGMKYGEEILSSDRHLENNVLCALIEFCRHYPWHMEVTALLAQCPQWLAGLRNGQRTLPAGYASKSLSWEPLRTKVIKLGRLCVQTFPGSSFFHLHFQFPDLSTLAASVLQEEWGLKTKK